TGCSATSRSPRAARAPRSCVSSSRSRAVTKMSLGRRLAFAISLAAATQTAPAQQAYPSHAVTVIVGFSAGGSVDVMARNLLSVISAQLGQQFVVVNKEGASGSIAFAGLAAAKPDGYTIGAGPTTPMSIAPHIHKDVRYGPES